MKILILLLFCLFPGLTWTQTKNTSTEVKDYREVDGKIILDLAVNGEMASFVLDLSGHTALLPEFLEKLKIDPEIPGDFQYNHFLYKEVPISKTVSVNTMAFGNNVFGNAVPAFVLVDEPYLRQLGVAGIVGGALFRNVVLTIDSKRKKITTSVPYRPSYMKLDHRADVKVLPGTAISCTLTIDGIPYALLLDTWSDGMISMTTGDFAKLGGDKGGEVVIVNGYKIAEPTAGTKIAGTCDFVKSRLNRIVISENAALSRSVLGNGILKEGIISIDYPKQKIYFQPFDLVEIKDEEVKDIVSTVEPGKLNPITRDYFLEHVYDYRVSDEFVFKGDKPVVIDFWATWCGPCMRLIPELEKMAEKYKGQIVFLKVNADKEKELCSRFNVNALPTLFFIPVGGKPVVEMGATPEKYEKIIQEQLLKK